VHRAKLLLYQAHKMIGVFGSEPLLCRSDADLFKCWLPVSAHDVADDCDHGVAVTQSKWIGLSN
jgi:hypothetical protein